MPLQFKDAPVDTQEPLSRAFDLLSSNQGAGKDKTEGDWEVQAAQAFRAVFPHPVYVLALDQAEQRIPIAKSAQPVGWRYLIPESGPTAAAEISLEVDGPRLIELNYGPYARNTLQEIQNLQQSPDFSGADYEVRLLRIPALSIAALWLKESSGKEVFIPLTPTHPALRAGERYSEEDLFNLIMPEVLRKKVEDTRPWLPSAQDVRIAVDTLSPAELLRLEKYARWRMRPLYHKAKGRNWEDLLQEAILATIEGRRVWTRNLSLTQHLIGVMQSISTNWRESVGEEYPESELPAEEAKHVFDLPGRSPDPERILQAKQQLRQIENLFTDDSEALEIVRLLGEGYSAKQIQGLLGISEQRLGAGIKRARRALARHQLGEVQRLSARDREFLQITDMLMQHYSPRQIQSRLGMSDRQILAALKRAGQAFVEMES